MGYLPQPSPPATALSPAAGALALASAVLVLWLTRTRRSEHPNLQKTPRRPASRSIRLAAAGDDRTTPSDFAFLGLAAALCRTRRLKPIV
ncbi:hypothetical protein ABR737_22175 [Streptomyces sp. Edi2]|uniref:hypothetical protein n=1 Tax=Streptomyces sp. Edi2 TaxID=3162528 RepID=UPI0033061737